MHRDAGSVPRQRSGHVPLTNWDMPHTTLTTADNVWGYASPVPTARQPPAWTQVPDLPSPAPSQQTRTETHKPHNRRCCKRIVRLWRAERPPHGGGTSAYGGWNTLQGQPVRLRLIIPEEPKIHPSSPQSTLLNPFRRHSIRPATNSTNVQSSPINHRSTFSQPQSSSINPQSPPP